MPLKNADSIVKLYFEADRRAMRERYESIYGLKPYENDEAESADEQGDTESDVSFDDALRAIESRLDLHG